MKQGYDKIPIHTVDTDVVVLAVTSAQRLNITELWIAFGARKNFQYLPAHEMAKALGLDRCVTLSMFHAFTGIVERGSSSQKGRPIVLQHKQYLSSTQSGLLTKPATVRHRR